MSKLDYIWIHSQVLPLSIIRSLNKKLPKNIAKFIFLHMSGLDSVPDEKPYIYLLEEKLSSLSLFISDETKKKIVKLLNKNMNFSFFKNPAPVELCQTSYKINKKINKILVVSNHPPDELLEACKILSFQKISIPFFTKKSCRYFLE